VTVLVGGAYGQLTGCTPEPQVYVMEYRPILWLLEKDEDVFVFKSDGV
jgi:hypothetical protein